LAYTKARSSVESKERREARLDFAVRAAEVGLESIAVPAREDQIRRGGKDFIEKIGPSEPIVAIIGRSVAGKAICHSATRWLPALSLTFINPASVVFGYGFPGVV
jgi:hypothetical protein